MIPQLHYRLGTLFNILDNVEKAISHYRQYLVNPKPDDDETYLITIRSLAHLHAKVGRYEASFDMYNELIQYLKIADDKNEVELATAYHDMGKIHLELRNFDEALKNMKNSIDIMKATQNSNENQNAKGKILFDMAIVYCQKKEYISATNTLLEVR